MSTSDQWAHEKRAIRATQLAFDLSTHVQKMIKKQAIDQELTPPDMIRRILGLQVKSKKTRQRLSFNLNDDELIVLAEKFGLDKNDKAAIKHRVAQELIIFATG